MAAMAKGLAGRSARAVARHAQQVLAGIGFTTEHPLHRYVRRTIVLDQLLGASSELTRQLGEDVLERGTLPPASRFEPVSGLATPGRAGMALDYADDTF
jgi:hypothetical protein